MKTIQSLVLAASFIALGAIPAQAQHGQDKKHKDKHEKYENHGNSAAAHAANTERKLARLTAQEQQTRIQLQQQRAAAYQTYLNQQVVRSRQLNAQLQQQKRLAQYRNQQRYEQNLQQQQARLRAAQNYQNDPYYYTPASYRYVVNGTTRTTNQYGADVLKQAVNYGYAEGYRAGQADKQDRTAYNYRTTYAYTDANYGYNGQYVERADYNYYFREGLRRGYDDGYNTRTQYGTAASGNPSILGSLVSTILNLVTTQQ